MENTEAYREDASAAGVGTKNKQAQGGPQTLDQRKYTRWQISTRVLTISTHQEKQMQIIMRYRYTSIEVPKNKRLTVPSVSKDVEQLKLQLL